MVCSRGDHDLEGEELNTKSAFRALPKLCHFSDRPELGSHTFDFMVKSYQWMYINLFKLHVFKYL